MNNDYIYPENGETSGLKIMLSMVKMFAFRTPCLWYHALAFMASGGKLMLSCSASELACQRHAHVSQVASWALLKASKLSEQTLPYD